VADELTTVPMILDEVTFGGDIEAITSAMKEAVSQVEEHVHNVTATNDVHLTNSINDVRDFSLVSTQRNPHKELRNTRSGRKGCDGQNSKIKALSILPLRSLC